MLIRSGYLRTQAIGERAAGAVFRQMETHRSAGDRAAGFVGHCHREWARHAGAGSVNPSLALKDLYLENSNLSRCDRGQR